MKKSSKLLLLFFVFATAFLCGCSEDIYDEHVHENGINRNKITLNQFKNETKIKDFSAFIKTNIESDNSLNRTTELSDFVIDTVAILRHVNENNEATYSFRIYSISSLLNQTDTFNLVYRKENNIWEKTIFSFNDLTNANTTEMLFDTKIDVERMSSVCISTSIVSHCEGCVGACDYLNCRENVCYRYTVTTITDCSSSGAGPSDPSGNGSNTMQSGYIPLNPYEFTPNIYDNPVFDDPNIVNQLNAAHFFSQLDYPLQVWANENTTAYNQLIDYLNLNNWEFSFKNFVINSMNELNNNGGLNINNEIVLGNNFENNQKAKCVFLKLISQNENFFKNIIDIIFASAKSTFLKFDIATIPQPNNGYYKAKTIQIYNSNGVSNNRYYKIVLDSNFVNNASNVEIAQVLIHEIIHAEILERCIKLGIIEYINDTSIKFFSNPIIYNNNSDIFLTLIQYYKNFNGGNSEWNHDLFTIFGYRAEIENSLLNIHAEINDINNDFFNNIVNDINRVGGNYSLQNLFYYISYIGLEGTQAFNTTINNNPNELIRFNYVESVIRSKYTSICTN